MVSFVKLPVVEKASSAVLLYYKDARCCAVETGCFGWSYKLVIQNIYICELQIFKKEDMYTDTRNPNSTH